MTNSKGSIIKRPSKTLKKKQWLALFIVVFTSAASFGLLSNPHSAHADITSNLVGWWKLDDGSGTAAVDSSGNGSTGTLGGSPLPTWTTGQIGGALNFGGNPSGDYVDMGNPAALSIATGTISAWINLATTSGRQIIISKDDWNNDRNGYQLYLNDTGNGPQIQVELSDATTSQTGSGPGFNGNCSYAPVTICEPTAAGVWYQVAVKWDGTNITYYLDGVNIGVVPETVTPISNVNNFELGKSPTYGASLFNGSIDDVRVYDRLLSDSDMQQLYNQGVSPIVTAQAATSFTQTSAVLNGTLTSDGGIGSTTVEGFAWGVTSSYGATTTSTGTFALGAFNTTLTGLTCNTIYHYTPYAANSYGTSTYATDTTFTTSACSGGLPPALTTSAPTLVSTSTLTLNANISSIGSSSVTQSGFAYGTSSTLTGSGISTSTLGSQSTGNFSQSLSSLIPNTTYYFRAYAANSQGTSTGAIVSTTTAVIIVPPTVAVPTFLSVASSSLTASSTVTAIGGATVTFEGFNYGLTSSYGSSASSSGSFSTGQFGQSLSGLTCNTTYHVQAFAVNSAGTATSTDTTVTTAGCPVSPTVTTSAPTSVSTSGLSFNANISSNGGASITQSGFTYGTSSTLTGSGVSTTTLGSQSVGSFSQSLSGLIPSTTYYFRAYAVNSAGTSTGSILSTTTQTLTVPGAPTGVVAAAGNTNANITFSAPTSNGGSAILYYYASSSPGNIVVTSAGSPITVSGLTNGQAYIFEVYAVNAVGTSSASVSSNSITPAAPASNNSNPQVAITSGDIGGTVSASDLADLLAPSAAATAYLQSRGLTRISNQENAQSSPPLTLTSTKDLSLGSKGKTVHFLQEYLNYKGYIIARAGPGSPGHETTLFGPLTKQALVQFQAAHSIPATGYFGPITKYYIETHP